MKLKTVLAVAAALAVCLPAHAAQKRLVLVPVDFVGDWCFSSQDKAKTSYTLPSWTEDGICKKILSVDQYSFSVDGGSCMPESMKVSKLSAQSGTSHSAVVVALCRADGKQMAEGKMRTFKFDRYKGNLTVTAK